VVSIPRGRHATDEGIPKEQKWEAGFAEGSMKVQGLPLLDNAEHYWSQGKRDIEQANREAAES